MALEKMHPVKKEQLCELIYEDYIVKSADILREYEKYSGILNGNLPESCYTNFRDALFHFRKLVYSLEEQEILCQEFAIKEHLARVLTDAASAVIDVIAWVAESMLRDPRIRNEWKAQIRLFLHKIKNLFLRKRLAGMMVSGDEIKVEHEEIIKSCDEFLKFANANCEDIFSEYSSRYVGRRILGIERIAYKKVVRQLVKKEKIMPEEISCFFPSLTDEDIRTILG